MAETEIRCPLKKCKYNMFGGRCTKRVITLAQTDITKLTRTLICDDYKRIDS